MFLHVPTCSIAAVMHGICIRRIYFLKVTRLSTYYNAFGSKTIYLANVLLHTGFMKIRRMSLSCCWFAVLGLTSITAVQLQAQDLELIGKKDPLKISGGINLSNVFYAAQGIDARRDPYTYFLTGNLNVDLYGWVVPVSFTYSNQNSSFQQPFNQYSIHPHYKWATAHIGYTSMTFSPYTLNGHIFKGVGLDLAPEGHFKFSAMYGRLQKAVEVDTINKNAQTAAFQRMGYGFKAGYKDDSRTVEVILFHAKDQVQSINTLALPEELRPQENLVLSIAGSQTFWKKISLQAELATSAMTRDTRAADAKPEQANVFSYTSVIYKPNVSSSFYNAFKSGISYLGKSYTIGFGYERVEPEYRTLGAYYFNSDLENFTINMTKALMKGKLNVAGNAGLQRDNLDDSKISTMKRFVGSINVGYTPSERISFTGAYSSFQTNTVIRSQFVNINQLTPYDNLDTLNYTQLSQNSNVNVNYVLKPKERYRQSINFNVAYQKASEKQGGTLQPSGSQFYNLNSSYTINIVPSSTAVSVAFNYNANQMSTLNTQTLGPTLGFQKSFFEKKMRTNIAGSYNTSYTNSELVGSVASIRLGGSYSVKKSHNISASLVVLHRTSKRATGSQEFTEYTGNLSYSYNF